MNAKILGYCAVGFALLSSYWWVYRIGYNAKSVEVQEETLQRINIIDEQTQQIRQQTIRIEDLKTQMEQSQNEQIKAINDYMEDDNRNKCAIDERWMHIYQNILQNTTSASSTAK